MKSSELGYLYEKLQASPYNSSVGGGTALDVADNHSENLISQIDFSKTTKILDFGCGIGRTMPMLFSKLGRDNIQLHGTDISSDFIREARKIHSKSNFQFFKIFAENSHYTNYGISRDEDKVPELYYDVAYSFSVFTHLNLQMAERTLSKVWSYLNDDGIYYFTFFRLDEESRRVINEGGNTAFGFSKKVGPNDIEYFAVDSDPLSFVAVRGDMIEAAINRTGFVVEKFTPGSWRGIRALNLHDSFVIRKVPRRSWFRRLFSF